MKPKLELIEEKRTKEEQERLEKSRLSFNEMMRWKKDFEANADWWKVAYRK